MKARSWLKAAGLVAASAFLTVLIALFGTGAFIYFNGGGGQGRALPSVRELSACLVREDRQYVFSGESMLSAGQWAMLLDENGTVVWSLRKPEDVPDRYSVAGAASFTRWYLNDYPVMCFVREDDTLFVAGSPKGSVWKHDIAVPMEMLAQIPFWFAALFLTALGCVLGLAYLVLRRWFRREQQTRDAARSNWVNGVSHDIRTPLSMVMGYAAQLEADPELPRERRRQAAVICRQSQAIRDLVNDLNLTMRLDYEMQTLRKERIQPEAFLRQVTADFYNSGMADGFPVEMAELEPGLPALEADGFLLRRALNNLLVNCVRHNPPGCPVRLGVRTQEGNVVFWVESGGAAELVSVNIAGQSQGGNDGGAPHGTGLKLVAQIAAAHGGYARFSAGTAFRCELCLPAGA